MVRTSRALSRAALLFVVIGLFASYPATAKPGWFSLGQWGTLGIDIPDGWVAEWQDAVELGGPAIRVRPPSDAPSPARTTRRT